MRFLAAALLVVALPIMAAVPCGKVCLLLLDGGHDCSYDTSVCTREDAGPVDAGVKKTKVVDAGPRWVDLGTWDPRPSPDEWRTDGYNSTPPEYGAYPLEQHPSE